MPKEEKPKNPKTNNPLKQIDLSEYKALKTKKSNEDKIPTPVKIFLSFPLLVLCFILLNTVCAFLYISL